MRFLRLEVSGVSSAIAASPGMDIFFLLPVCFKYDGTIWC
jgi:hypothetical protein